MKSLISFKQKVSSLSLSFSLAFVAIMSGCGYFSDKPEDTKIYVVSELDTICEINSDAFGDILDSDITKDINCLESNLNQFNKYVAKENTEVIQESELTKFVEKFYDNKGTNNIPTMKKAIHILFQLNTLAFSDVENSMSIKNINLLITLLKSINQEGPVIKNVFKTTDSDSSKFWDNRNELEKSVASFSEKIRNIIQQTSSTQEHREKTSINVVEVIKSVDDLSDDLTFDIDLVESFIFIKKLFLGGNKEILTSKEFDKLLEIAPTLSKTLFDLVYVKEEHFEGQKALLMDFYNLKIDEVEKLIFNSNESIFSRSELIRALDKAEEEFNANSDAITMVKTFINSKDQFIGGDLENYFTSDITKLLFFARIGTQIFSIKDDFDDLSEIVKSEPTLFNTESKKFLQIAEDLSDEIKSIISASASKNELKDLNSNFVHLIRELDKTNENFSISEGKIELVKILKNILIGSEFQNEILPENFVNSLSNNLSYEEIEKLNNLFPALASIYFDFSSVSKDSFDNDNENTDSNVLLNDFYQQLIIRIENIVDSNKTLTADANNNKMILTDTTILSQLKEFIYQDDIGEFGDDIKKKDELYKTLESIVKSKPSILGGTEKKYNYTELKKLFFLGQIGVVSLPLIEKYQDAIDIIKEKPLEFHNQKIVINDYATSLQTRIDSIFKSCDSKQQAKNINIEFVPVIRELDLALGDFSITENKLELVQIVKRLILGNLKNIISYQDIKILNTILPKTISTAFDVQNASKEAFNGSNKDLMNHYKIVIQNFEKLIDSNPNLKDLSNEILFSNDYVLNLAKEIIFDSTSNTKRTLTEQEELYKQITAITKLKKQLIGGDTSNYLLVDLRRILFLAQAGTSTLAISDEYSEIFERVQDDPMSFYIEREKFLSLVTELSQTLQTIILNARNSNDTTSDITSISIDYLSLIRELDIATLDFEISSPKLEMLTIIKKLLLGGEHGAINFQELDRLAKIFPGIGALFFDYMNIQKETFNDDSRALDNFYGELLIRLDSLISQNSKIKNDDYIFNNSFILNIAPEFLDIEDADDQKTLSYIRAFTEAKKLILGGDANNYILKDVRILLHYGRVALDLLGTYNYLDEEVFIPLNDEIERERIAKEDESDATNDSNNDNYSSDGEGNLSNEQIRSMKEKYKIFTDAISSTTKRTLSNFNNFPTNPIDLDIIKIAEIIKKETNNEDIDLDLITKALPLKRLITKGITNKITFSEIKTVTSKADNLLDLVFVAKYMIDEKSFENENARFYQYLNSYLKFYGTIEDLPSNEIVVSLSDLIFIVDNLTDDEYNIKNYEETAAILKKKVFTGEGKQFTFNDIKYFLNAFRELLEVINHSHETFDQLRARGLLTRSSIQIPNDLNHSSLIRKNYISTYDDEFAAVTNRVKYFRDDNGFQFYRHDLVKTKYGHSEALLTRWLVNKLTNGYGHIADPSIQKREIAICDQYVEEKKSNPNKYKDYTDYRKQNRYKYDIDSSAEHLVNSCEMEVFLWEMKPLLEEFNLWTTKPDTFATNTVTLADLFQANSDGDTELGTDELSEYLSLVLTSVQVSDKIINELKTRCSYGNDEEAPLFESECYRKEYFDIIYNELNLKNYFSTLYKFTQQANQKDLIDFLINIEAFAKDTPPEVTVVSVRDLTLVFGALLNIESMLIRFDDNKSNILDPKEVDNAYPTFKTVVLKYSGIYDLFDYMGQTAFELMIKKKGEIPSGLEVASNCNLFTKKCDNLDVSAERGNISAILAFFVRPTED